MASSDFSNSAVFSSRLSWRFSSLGEQPLSSSARKIPALVKGNRTSISSLPVRHR